MVSPKIDPKYGPKVSTPGKTKIIVSGDGKVASGDPNIIVERRQ